MLWKCYFLFLYRLRRKVLHFCSDRHVKHLSPVLLGRDDAPICDWYATSSGAVLVDNNCRKTRTDRTWLGFVELIFKLLKFSAEQKKQLFVS